MGLNSDLPAQSHRGVVVQSTRTIWNKIMAALVWAQVAMVIHFAYARDNSMGVYMIYALLLWQRFFKVSTVVRVSLK